MSSERMRRGTGTLALIATVLTGSTVAGILGAVWFFAGYGPEPANRSGDPAWGLERLFLSGLVGSGVAFVAFAVLNGTVTLVGLARRRRAAVRRP